MVPRSPHGRSHLSAFLKWCWARLTGQEKFIVAGPGITVGLDKDARYIIGATGQVRGNRAVQIVRFTITAVNDDDASVLATPTDTDSAIGPTEIAYPPLLLPENEPFSIVGYPPVIEPAYAVGQEIIAAQLEDGSWVDVTVGRAWGINLPICLPGGVECEAIVHCGSLYPAPVPRP